MIQPIALESVLVANRGEIAVRILKTCARFGVRSIAIYTAADAGAMHVRMASEAVEVSSYLDIDAVVGAALTSGAASVHPGYGFLSERAAFAKALEDADVLLVGPSSTVMEQMGRKDAARQIAVAAGVPVVPTGEDAPFPVLVKAASGGGGKGMRIVRAEGDLAEATAAAKREALSSFGDDTVLIEKYVEHGRHIEVQVLGDTHGNVVHLHERDCSTQRRHQKVIEEAPAPTLTDEQRESVTSAAVALARHVGYVSAGTVEFLLDTDTGEAYFLEMNTRLQVEHPVTETITGLDLVEEQLRIAAGEPLRVGDRTPGPYGHAIEVRVYAEDPYADFLPQAGTASLVRWPDHGIIRTDHALESGQVVGTSFDPMLGKIIAHGRDREDCRQLLVQALDRTAILGLTTNVGFLRQLVASDEFRDATIDTAWLDTAVVPEPSADVPRIVAAWTSAMLTAMDGSHVFAADGFRLGAPPAPTVVELDREVVVDRHAGTVDGTPVRQLAAADHKVRLVIDGATVDAVVNAQPGFVDVALHGQRFLFTAPDRLAGAAAVGDGTLTAPMPGTVLEVRVAEGDAVAEGDVLGTMEAMKMELSLKAPFAGTVVTVDAVVGAQVPLGSSLFVVEPAEDDA
ncbi:biotin carboxylase N-terminal domain-containing protein [Nocardioides sp.]|uniref:acetyl/propionyl/methylcrotonyl-CoA carboxylase subunit alpha n=1 Tax=Nocardioides sp. TaxID=35761 RepID=UPI00271DE9C8|nr:biotin carboxylase N-terminal domain-containing protein [Nocardioides sp.]MDO9457567.1 biotin carboxylase N-terminal domain-containing protein [Nocardioides sp.]